MIYLPSLSPQIYIFGVWISFKRTSIETRKRIWRVFFAGIIIFMSTFVDVAWFVGFTKDNGRSITSRVINLLFCLLHQLNWISSILATWRIFICRLRFILLNESFHIFSCLVRDICFQIFRPIFLINWIRVINQIVDHIVYYLVLRSLKLWPRTILGFLKLPGEICIPNFY